MFNRLLKNVSINTKHHFKKIKLTGSLSLSVGCALFNRETAKPNQSPEATLFKKCINEPIIDTWYEGPQTLDSNDYCNSKFENTVPNYIRCQHIFLKCLKTPIIDTSYEGGGEEIDNTQHCLSEAKKCIY